jgi:hypothetical protein
MSFHLFNNAMLILEKRRRAAAVQDAERLFGTYELRKAFGVRRL